MAVDDHGLEVLKKAGEEVTPGDKSDTYLKVSDIAKSPFAPPRGTDAFTAEYVGNFIIYKFRSGGIAGTILKTVTLEFTKPQTPGLLNGVVT